MSIDACFRLTRGEFKLNVSFSAPARGVTAIFGPSGCGKTTLLRAIAGLDAGLCSEAHLRIGSSVWQEDSFSLPTHKRPLGYVFQEPSLFTHLSVKENLEYGFKRLQLEKRKIGFDQAVALLGLENLLERRPESLSGGEQHRTAIARALLRSPELLLMDEPLAALDVQSKQEILPFFERLRDELEIPIFYVSHVTEEVSRLADYLVLMGCGEVLAEGSITEMLTSLDLPLARERDAESLILGKVSRHDAEFSLTYLDFSGGSIAVAENKLSVGEKARVRILARDVSLTLERQQGTSILNIFPATVVEILEENPAQVLVKLKASGTTLLSRITRKSAARMALKPESQVFVQVKSAALLR